MPTELDLLMDLDPLELSLEEGTEGRRNLDAIIAYHRNNRAKEGVDGRLKKPKGESVDLSGVLKGLLEKAKPAAAPKPTTGGLRRL